MQDKITLAIDALASAAFIEGGVSPENTQAARELTEQRKRELVAAICTPCLAKISEPAKQITGIRDAVLRGITTQSHSIDSNRVTIEYSGRGKNALDELASNIAAEIEAAAVAAPALEAPAGFISVAAYDRLHAHCESLAARILAFEDAHAVEIEPMTRYCPGCGSVGPVDYTKHRDCCPDGGQARMIPEKLAQKCHDTFQIAVAGLQAEPLAKPPGIDALMCVIASLRDTAHCSDEDGELTNELRDLRDWAFSQLTAPQATQPDKDLEQALQERDDAEDMADQLAAQIAAITAVDIGEHTSANDPWRNAMLAADDWIADALRKLMSGQPQATQPQAPAAPVEREDFAWLVVQEACETEPADEDDPECIRILRRDLKTAVLAALLRGDIEPAAPAAPAVDALDAKDRECIAIGRAIQRAAGELPVDGEIRIDIENGAGAVYVLEPKHGDWRYIDSGDVLSAQINEAIDAANAAAKGAA